MIGGAFAHSETAKQLIKNLDESLTIQDCIKLISDYKDHIVYPFYKKLDDIIINHDRKKNPKQFLEILANKGIKIEHISYMITDIKSITDIINSLYNKFESPESASELEELDELKTNLISKKNGLLLNLQEIIKIITPQKAT